MLAERMEKWREDWLRRLEADAWSLMLMKQKSGAGNREANMPQLGRAILLSHISIQKILVSMVQSANKRRLYTVNC